MYYSMSVGVANGRAVLVSLNSIDPFYIEKDEKKFLFWGSFSGIFAIELSDGVLTIQSGAEKYSIMQSLLDRVFSTAHYCFLNFRNEPIIQTKLQNMKDSISNEKSLSRRMIKSYYEKIDQATQRFENIISPIKPYINDPVSYPSAQVTYQIQNS